MGTETLVIIIATAVITGLIATIGNAIATVYGLRVHISYINKSIDNVVESVNKLEDDIRHAHNRIDGMRRNGCQGNGDSK